MFFTDVGNTFGVKTPKICNPRLESAVKLVMYLAPVATVTVVPVTVLLNLDPLSVWWSTKAENVWSLRKVTSWLVRTLLLNIIAFEILKTAIAILVIAVIMLSATATSADKLDKYVNSKPTFQTVSKLPVIKLYKEIQIWNQYTNINVCYDVVPPLIFFGICVIIVTNYATVRLLGKLSGWVYSIAPGTSLAGIVFIMNLLPEAANVYENSNKFLSSVRSRLIGKYEKRWADL